MAMSHTTAFQVRNYDLAATLTSGQAFRWRPVGSSWVGVVDGHWVKLQSDRRTIYAETPKPVSDWSWLAGYLQVDAELAVILKALPDDEPMRRAVAACKGLRLLRQDPWECLASFILSSTKQIIQIQQIIGLLCRRFGKPVIVPAGEAAEHAFPTAVSIAATSEKALRDCKMGFRAPYLLSSARWVADGKMDLRRLGELSLAEARDELMRLPGVGRKIADCVLLFAYGFPAAFPMDVWVMKALRQLYFPGRQIGPRGLETFVACRFGPHAGYAQQYLFHYMRTKMNPRFLSAHENH